MNGYEFVGMLAQAQPEGNPVLGWLILGGVGWALFALFTPKKRKFAVRPGVFIKEVK